MQLAICNFSNELGVNMKVALVQNQEQSSYLVEISC